MARQSNLAYDFERFETQRKVKPKAKVQLEVVKKQQAQKTRYLIAKTATCIAIFFVGVLGIILSQVAITEVTMQITNCNQELELLQSDYRTLTAELESTMALNNIETIVTREMGMSKLREDQVTYVSLSDGDSVDALKLIQPPSLSRSRQPFPRCWNILHPGKIQWNNTL